MRAARGFQANAHGGCTPADAQRYASIDAVGPEHRTRLICAVALVTTKVAAGSYDAADGDMGLEQKQ